MIDGSFFRSLLKNKMQQETSISRGNVFARRHCESDTIASYLQFLPIRTLRIIRRAWARYRRTNVRKHVDLQLIREILF